MWVARVYAQYSMNLVTDQITQTGVVWGIANKDRTVSDRGVSKTLIKGGAMKIGKTFSTKTSKAKLFAVGLLAAAVMSVGATASTSAQGWWGNDWNNNWWGGWRFNRCCVRWNPCHRWNNWNNWGWNNWNNWDNWGWGGGGNSSIIIND